MAATATSKEIPAAAAATGIAPKDYRTVIEILGDFGLVPSIEPEYQVHDAFSKAVGGALKLISSRKGRISCILTAKPPLLNGLGRLHGLTVASVAERVAIACAKTVLGEEKDLFLGELSNTYLSSAPRNAEVMVEASVVRSGRNLTIVTVTFQDPKSERLLYSSRATFYNMPVSRL